MLVLERKNGERIIISIDGRDVIEIEVKGASKGRTKLAIEAPREFKILREELTDVGLDAE